MRFCLLPSPLTTPAVAGPLATSLRSRGHEAVVAGAGGSSVHAVFGGFVDAADGADVVVPHSNAGRFGPGVAEAVRATLVCVDSLLPGDALEPGMVQFLRDRELSDGLLAPWSAWWPRVDLDEVVGGHWDLLTTDEPRVPLAMLAEQPPVPDDWPARTSGYVAFGETYAEQAALAEASGWPVRRLEGKHLHLLTHPDEVAVAVLQLAALLDVESRLR